MSLEADVAVTFDVAVGGVVTVMVRGVSRQVQTAPTKELARVTRLENAATWALTVLVVLEEVFVAARLCS